MIRLTHDRFSVECDCPVQAATYVRGGWTLQPHWLGFLVRWIAKLPGWTYCTPQNN